MKKILITGCCGTIGRSLIKKLASDKKNYLICIDNNEGSLFELLNVYKKKKIKFLYCDVRDKEKLNEIMTDINVCFHTAALKHVSLCEDSPEDAIKTNVDGINNLIDVSISNKIDKFVFTSSDKSVNPTNVMGTTKLMGEKLITAANFRENNKKTIFTSVRFGNVIGSSGSVVPIFFDQIINKKKLTITDKNMTRFLMGLNDAVSLILNSEKFARGGEIFISKMPSTNIYDLALSMIEIMNEKNKIRYSKNMIKYVGIRTGEKLYEELINNEELNRTFVSSKFFIVLPKIYKVNNKNYKFKFKKYNNNFEIKSNNNKNLTKDKIKKLLLNNFSFN